MAVSLSRLGSPAEVGARPCTTSDPFAHIVGESAAIREAVQLARQVAASPVTTVLLEGETGTGKELLARGVHNASAAAGAPFVAINCAAIPENLLESELFGHERGAFSGARQLKPGLMEHANTGTMFLDEVHQLPLALQAKLLRVLEERRFRRLGGLHEQAVHCRIIAGANTTLDRAVVTGRFRSDLFYRLNVFRIELAALRDRPEDIVPIAEHFLHEIAVRRGMAPKHLHDTSEALLHRHTWPGNAREVRNVVERASILAPGSVIKPSHLRLERRELVAFGEADGIAGTIVIPNRGKTLEEVEREAIRATMILTAGNLSAAARLLGISRPTLARKMRESGLSRRSLLASS
jgi:transcriptional regulator with PAS, ATPase and Fis domain